MSFDLDLRLANDTIELGNFELCRVLLMNHAHFPWVILVPRVSQITEIHQLTSSEQQQLMKEITHTSETMQTLFSADKMNVAALGNMVPQLHIHIIARFKHDAAWPKPVWGHPQQSYATVELEKMVSQLQQLFK